MVTSGSLPPPFTLSGGSWRRSGWWLRDQCSLLERPRQQIPPLSIMQLGWLGENYVWTIAAAHNQELTILESSKYASGSQWICKICNKREATFRFSKHKLLRCAGAHWWTLDSRGSYQLSGRWREVFPKCECTELSMWRFRKLIV